MPSLKRCTSNGGFSVSIDIILEASRVPFVICGLAIVALIALLVIRATTNAKFLGGYVTETDSALVRFMLAGLPLYWSFCCRSRVRIYRVSHGRGCGSDSYCRYTPARLCVAGASCKRRQVGINRSVRKTEQLSEIHGDFHTIGTHWPTVGDDRTHPILRCVGANKAQRLPRSHETYARCVHRFICPASS
jgi:hypothetical protein